MSNDAASKGWSRKESRKLPVELPDGTLQFHNTKEMRNFASLIAKQAFIRAKHDLTDEEHKILTQSLPRKPVTVVPIGDNKSSDIRFLNVVTNFEERLIWKEGARDKRQDFRTSLIRGLWRLLLENKGIALSKKDIRKQLETQSNRETDLRKFNLGQTLDNLKRKLVTISGEDRKTVTGWFEETPTTLAVRNLD